MKGNTGGPRNSRTFYLRIRLFAICKHIPNLIICECLGDLPRLSAIFKQFEEKNMDNLEQKQLSLHFLIKKKS